MNNGPNWANETGNLWRLSTEVAGGTTLLIGLITPPSKSIYLDQVSFVTSSDDASFSLYEGISYTGGTPLTLRNRNRNFSAAVSPLQDSKTGVTATLVPANIIGTARSVISQRGQAVIGDPPSPLILRPNTSYVLQIITANTPASNNVTGFGSSIYTEN